MNVPFHDTVAPRKNETGLHCFLILPQFDHKGAQFGNATVESRVEPTVKFFSPPLSYHLEKELKQRGCVAKTKLIGYSREKKAKEISSQ
ncbi:hypothetical protein KSF_104980 [Reticulibacter mediterranei]|uniref:Uncharacterized protein n=1 Tax=Reticulibacter mediterranei TaxID=2778369 RepID=A0A8J3N9C5_9CHLR|nr:hypothetical protein KSF_104980 [Reticulibacter mediterranei]